MNGFYLHLLLKEIKYSIIGSRIDEIWLRNREIQIELNDDRVIFVSLYPEAPAIFLTKRIQGFHKFTYFSNYLRGNKIAGVHQPDFKPIVKLQLKKPACEQKKYREIIIWLYREAPNLGIATEKINRNLFARVVKKDMKQSIFEIINRDLDDKENIIKNFEGVDKYLIQELNAENLRKLKAILRGKEAKPKLISIKPLRISFFANQFIEEFSSLNKLLEYGVKKFIELQRTALFEVEKRNLLKRIKKKIGRLKDRLPDDKDIEGHRVAGELILTNISKIKKGMKEIRIFNPYEKREINIRLDSKKNPQDNAQDYFRRYKKMKRGKPRILGKIKVLEKEAKDIKAEAYIGRQKVPFNVAATLGGCKLKPRLFKEFHLPSGSVVHVGKDARSNEALTFKFAKSNDYFFHVRGYGGSHTILKAEVPRGQRPKKEDIEAAASIAAHFSKARNQKNIAVSYTQRKYLKKDKKGKPGSVILMREEVIFVDPALPPSSDHF